MQNWYEEFFQGIALDLWQKAVTPEQTEAEAAFIESALGVSPPARVLDVACGNGRHALVLGAKGYLVTGVDVSAEQIARAQSEALSVGVGVDWHQRDMQQLDWENEFDGAYCFGNSFGYLDPAATRVFLHGVARALKPGARFLMDTGIAAESILTHLREREWVQVDDIYFLEQNDYNVEQSLMETTYTFIRAGEVTVRKGIQWVHTVREIRGLLAEAGLAPQEMYSSLDKQPFAAGAHYLLVLSQKQ